jgi:multidrug efflux pump subunit AcrA (membrane-fusion protein)
VDGDNTVKQNYLTLGTLQGNLRVVKSGLQADDRVIVNGLMRARSGAKVTPVEEGAAPPGGQQPGAPAPK